MKTWLEYRDYTTFSILNILHLSHYITLSIQSNLKIREFPKYILFENRSLFP